jgi:putative addiction module killer protein
MIYQIKQTEIFSNWHHSLSDRKAKHAITRRLDIAEAGSLGHVRAVGAGVSEMKIDVGPGYRLYFTMRGRTVIFLLCGGDKRTQDADIKRAKELAKEL